MERLLATATLIAAIALVACNKTAPAPDAEVGKKQAQAPVVEPFLEDVDAARAGELIKLEEAPIVLDVRTPEEFAEGHIEGAVNVDFNSETFKEGLAKLDPEKTYLFHCRSGGRSSAAKPVFEELGFKRLYHLDGGMIAWEKAGLPTQKP